MKSIKGKVQLLVVFMQIIPLILVTQYSLITFSNNQMDNNSEIMNLQVSNIENVSTKSKDQLNDINKIYDEQEKLNNQSEQLLEKVKFFNFKK